MTENRDILWQAYLDGELSLSETSDFEASLTAEERERLAAEMTLENAVADRLAENATCSDELWQKVTELVDIEESSESDRRSRWYWLPAPLVAAAAAIALAVGISFFTPPNSPAVVMAAQTVDELAAMSSTGSDHASVQKYLSDCGVRLKIKSIKDLNARPGSHPITLLGATTENADGIPVTELLFDCCGHPLKVLMAEHGSAAAMEIARACGILDEVQSTRLIDDYLTAVVGGHTSHDLLDALAPE